MKKVLITLIVVGTSYLLMPLLAQTEGPTRKLSVPNLMHEMRETPSPLHGSTIDDRFVSFQWPLPNEIPTDKSKLTYQIRYAKNADFTQEAVTATTQWPFYNPEKPLKAGTWYWQYGYVENGKTHWSQTLEIHVKDHPHKFCPPSLNEVLKKVPHSHPRILVEKKNWNHFRKATAKTTDRKWYLERANTILVTPMKTVKDINTSQVKNLKNPTQITAYLTRESRRIIDAEESNCTGLIYAYLLTKDRKYADECIQRVLTMIDWDKDKNVKGDFNASALLNISSMAYDAFYDLLSDNQRQILLTAVKEKGAEMYHHFNNYLENHIAENHIWQMTFRILTMAAFSVYGDLPEADTWVDYCYNVWLARFPGLNKDGGWHNGDSYFTVNTRTLIEVPYFYGRLTGFDYFSDPWYTNNVMYTIFQQPPFSKSGGNGSSHQNVMTPSSRRVGYLDALAKVTHNTYAADFVRRTLAKEPEYLKEAVLHKSGDLGWFRLQHRQNLPQGDGLETLPAGYVFPATGLASFHTNWNQPTQNCMWSFRSSPYGSTSHAMANQNAFNTFYGGKSIFYSSGHHISFTDLHSMLCHRGTKGHNTILVNGMNQRIGVEGYGWIPRHYVGKKIGYVLGDASKAYGKVTSPLWIKRAAKSEVALTPENGWDEVPLTTFRRHMIHLGNSGYIFIYDELEASEPADYTYQLHTVTQPMKVNNQCKDYVHVEGSSGYGGVSDAYIFSSGTLKTDTTSQFFVPAHNWLRADDKGHFKKYPNHWHFTAKSEKATVYRFATFIHTHAAEQSTQAPQIHSDGHIEIPGWHIEMNISTQGVSFFFIRSTQEGEKVNIRYHKNEATVVQEDGHETILTDQLPELEI